MGGVVIANISEGPHARQLGEHLPVPSFYETETLSGLPLSESPIILHHRAEPHLSAVPFHKMVKLRVPTLTRRHLAPPRVLHFFPTNSEAAEVATIVLRSVPNVSLDHRDRKVVSCKQQPGGNNTPYNYDVPGVILRGAPTPHVIQMEGVDGRPA